MTADGTTGGVSVAAGGTTTDDVEVGDVDDTFSISESLAEELLSATLVSSDKDELASAEVSLSALDMSISLSAASDSLVFK